MKTVSSAMRAHLDGTVTTLATCWEITRRDGETYRFTDHDRDLTIGDDVYSALSGYTRTAIENEASLGVDNLEVQGYIAASGITRASVEAGLWDRAEVRIFAVNWADLTQGIIRLRRGWLGEVTATPRGLLKTELRGLTQAFSQRILELFGPECRADLGDHRCKIPINPPLRQNLTNYVVGDFVRVATAYELAGDYSDFENRIYRCTTAGTTDSMAVGFDTTVGNTTNDGSVVWTAVEAWTRHAEITAVTDRLNFTISVDEPRAVDGWFNYGAVIFESGPNEGAVVEIKGWTQSGGVLELFAPAPFLPEVGDSIRLYKGCDKTRESCVFFQNIVNFRGEPFMTGNDYVFGSRGTAGLQ